MSRYKVNHFLVEVFLFAILFTSCDNEKLKRVFQEYPQLYNLMSQYEDSPNKKEALLYIVKNADEWDKDLLNADSLKYAINTACVTWENTPWHKKYTKQFFLEYILPSRVSNEPLEYYWRSDITKWLKVEIDNDMFKTAQRINSQIKIYTSRENWSNPPMGYTKTMGGLNGKCDDRAILSVMAMRSYGIPAVFESVPHWGSTNNGHSLCSVILPNDSVVVFQYTNDNGGNAFMLSKTPKVYRQMFSVQTHTVLYKYKDQECIPPLFLNFRLADVTQFHNIGRQNVKVKLDKTPKSQIIYMAVFSPYDWFPIAYAKRDGDHAHFSALGDGTDGNGKTSTSGENIGDGILYLPCCYIENVVVPIANPVVVSASGIKEIKCDTINRESIVITRKYPRLNRSVDFASEMIGGAFEVSNKLDFSDSKEIHFVAETPLSRQQRIQVSAVGRYIRFRKPEGIYSLAELKVFNDLGKEIKGKIIATKSIELEESVRLISDGDPLTYFELDGGLDVWTGLQFSKPEKIKTIEFAPRNDDNEIYPGDDYELSYWDGRWISLEVKKANDYFLKFDDVPKEALLWLRNLTRGQEERPFTYHDGIQIWW